MARIEFKLQALQGSTVDKAHCHYKQEPAAQPGAFSLLLGDIYAEDEKDVLLTLKLPALPAARGASPPRLGRGENSKRCLGGRRTPTIPERGSRENATPSTVA